MYYKVTAQFKIETAKNFHQKLSDGTIAQQKPDGQEIVDSMKRAVVTDERVVQWSEVCYCATPLAHERETVLDKHFDNMTTEEIDEYKDYQGTPFMFYLEELIHREDYMDKP